MLTISSLNGKLPKEELKINQRSYLPNSAFEADFLWKVSLKTLNSGIILKTFTHGQIKIVNKGQVMQDFQRKIVVIFLTISLNKCFGRSKEPSH